MNASKTKRAGMLFTALADIKAIGVELRKKRPPKYCEGRTLEIKAAEMQDGHGTGSCAYIYIDAQTGLKLLPIIENRIRAELRSLGVKA